MGLCDNLEWWMRWEVAERFKREGAYVYLLLIHIVAGQKPIHCKAIILQFKKSDIIHIAIFKTDNQQGHTV